MPFPQVPTGARRILSGWWRLGWLWCCGKSCWWCSRPNKVVQRVQVRGGGVPVSTLSESKPGSLWTCGPAPSPAATPRSATGPLIAPGDHHTLQHIQVRFGVDFQADFEDVRWYDLALTWNFVFITLGTSLLFMAIQQFTFWGCWQWSCCYNLDW